MSKILSFSSQFILVSISSILFDNFCMKVFCVFYSRSSYWILTDHGSGSSKIKNSKCQKASYSWRYCHQWSVLAPDRKYDMHLLLWICPKYIQKLDKTTQYFGRLLYFWFSVNCIRHCVWWTGEWGYQTVHCRRHQGWFIMTVTITLAWSKTNISPVIIKTLTL